MWQPCWAGANLLTVQQISLCSCSAVSPTRDLLVSPWASCLPCHSSPSWLWGLLRASKSQWLCVALLLAATCSSGLLWGCGWITRESSAILKGELTGKHLSICSCMVQGIGAAAGFMLCCRTQGSAADLTAAAHRAAPATAAPHCSSKGLCIPTSLYTHHLYSCIHIKVLENYSSLNLNNLFPPAIGVLADPVINSSLSFN